MNKWQVCDGLNAPVNAFTLVDVRMRGGKYFLAERAGKFKWEHNNSESDIISFRIYERSEAAERLNGASGYLKRIDDEICETEGKIADLKMKRSDIVRFIDANGENNEQ